MTTQNTQVIDPVLAGTLKPIAKKLDVAVEAMANQIYQKLAIAKKGTAPTFQELIEFSTLCSVAGLNPCTNQVYPLTKGGVISLIVSADGWTEIVNRQKNYDGMDFEQSEETVQIGSRQVPAWIDCKIYRKDLSRPIIWRSYFLECYQDRSPVWQKMPCHMLRLRAMTNAIKRAFSVSGCYSDDLEIAQQAETNVPAEVVEAKPEADKLAQAVADIIPDDLTTEPETVKESKKAKGGSLDDLIAEAVSE